MMVLKSRAIAKPTGKRPYKVIATEESFTIPEITQAQARYLQTRTDEIGASWLLGLNYFPVQTDLKSHAPSMDCGGVDRLKFGISAPGVQIFSTDEGNTLPTLSNDSATDEWVRRYPGRFASMATLASQDPTAVAQQLECAVTKFGAEVGIIKGHSNGEYFDREMFMERHLCE
jgi:predicted TIM-barrel fold metal-dependent hydrolase